MTTHPVEVHQLDDLRCFVETTLCEQNELETGAFPMTERVLLRRGEPCGMYFCVHGPRSVKLTAIWETDRNSILFYDSSGARRMRTQLCSMAELPLMRHA